MQQLADPILRDLIRLVARHADLSPDYKARLMTGLAAIDRELTDARAEAEVEPKRGKR
jgi:hypothetical protein